VWCPSQQRASKGLHASGAHLRASRQHSSQAASCPAASGWPAKAAVLLPASHAAGAARPPAVQAAESSAWVLLVMLLQATVANAKWQSLQRAHIRSTPRGHLALTAARPARAAACLALGA